MLQGTQNPWPPWLWKNRHPFPLPKNSLETKKTAQLWPTKMIRATNCHNEKDINPFEIEQKICSHFIRNYPYIGVSAEICATRPVTTSITSCMFRALQVLGKR